MNLPFIHLDAGGPVAILLFLAVPILLVLLVAGLIVLTIVLVRRANKKNAAAQQAPLAPSPFAAAESPPYPSAGAQTSPDDARGNAQ